jgi:uncharacterized membrane protein YedE/YeeE
VNSQALFVLFFIVLYYLFSAYLVAMSICQTTQRRMAFLDVNKEEEKLREEAAI